MTPQSLRKLERELTIYLDGLTEGMGRPERRAAMAQYVTGLLLDGERKSIEPIAARLVDCAGDVQAMRQRLQQCITEEHVVCRDGVFAEWPSSSTAGCLGSRSG